MRDESDDETSTVSNKDIFSSSDDDKSSEETDDASNEGESSEETDDASNAGESSEETSLRKRWYSRAQGGKLEIPPAQKLSILSSPAAG